MVLAVKPHAPFVVVAGDGGEGARMVPAVVAAAGGVALEFSGGGCGVDGVAAKVVLVLLVYKVITVFNKVNAARSRVTTADRVTTAGWIKPKIDSRSRFLMR
nr:hypothetical protein [Tanacetum cinerariifolium]